MRVIFISVEGKPEVLETEGRLSQLQAFVGGYIEGVDLDPGTTLYLNEEGKLSGLPVNEVATRLTRGIVSWHDLIVGDVVITGFDAETGENTDVSDAWVTRLLGVQ